MTEPGLVRVQLEATPGSARAAREVLRGLFEHSRARPDVVATALLMVSELVMNAASRGQGGFTTLEAQLVGNLLRVSVTEPDPSPAADPGIGSDDADSVASHGSFDAIGVGLLLVDELATRWGVDTTGGEVAVWFELSFLSAV